MKKIHPRYDLDFFKKNFKNEPGIIPEILNILKKSFELSAFKLKLALVKNDLETIKHHSRMWKNNFEKFGAEDLQSLCYKVEHNIHRKKHLDSLHLMVMRIIIESSSFINHLEEKENNEEIAA